MVAESVSWMLVKCGSVARNMGKMRDKIAGIHWAWLGFMLMLFDPALLHSHIFPNPVS